MGPGIKPIVKPGTPAWADSFNLQMASRPDRRSLTAFGAMTGLLIADALLIGLQPDFATAGIVVFLALVAGFIGVGVAATLALRGRVVMAPDYAYEGVPIAGEAFDLLADTQSRFAWAERMMAQVPTGIGWSDVADQVDVLLWEAAGYAAKVSALDVELNGLVYADPGTPQAVLRDELTRRRQDLMTALHETQREADELAREASNTAAAARVALARTGSVYDLEVVAPSGAHLVAKGTLAAARARLALLAEVWSELDESGALRAARLGIDEGSSGRKG
jgi:hypothetical protein